MRFCIEHGDCLDVLRQLDDDCVDAVVTDPPSGTGFMGRAWDRMKRDGMTELQAFQEFIREVFTEVYRVLKPGGHAVVWALPRTSHHTAMGLERAGFDIRDNGTYLFHVFGSGFPKSLDVSKAVDAHVTQGRSNPRALRVVNETRPGEARIRKNTLNGSKGFVGAENAGASVKRDTPATDAAKARQGWGTALKPAVEFWIVARKPLDGTVAENVLAHGTGALNIDGCRVQYAPNDMEARKARTGENAGTRYGHAGNVRYSGGELAPVHERGRWPAHLILDEGAAATMGEPSRFFYVPKANKRDKDEGLDDLPERSPGEKTDREDGSAGITAYSGSRGVSRNSHPTVKSTALMAWLVRLVTPPGGVVLDPFMGSGSTGKAALLAGFRFIGIERESEYFVIAQKRIEYVDKQLATNLA